LVGWLVGWLADGWLVGWFVRWLIKSEQWIHRPHPNNVMLVLSSPVRRLAHHVGTFLWHFPRCSVSRVLSSLDVPSTVTVHGLKRQTIPFKKRGLFAFLCVVLFCSNAPIQYANHVSWCPCARHEGIRGSGDRAPLILNLALDGGEWSASSRRQNPRHPLKRSLGEPTAVVGVLGKTKICCPCRNRTTTPR
jgi:hypothetical protein